MLIRLLAAGAAVSLPSPRVFGCATCFGAADAPETRAAASAVIVLAAVVYVVLMGFGSVTLLWLVRARRHAAALSTNRESPLT